MHQTSQPQQQQPILVPAGRGRAFDLGDHRAECVLDAEQTGGAFSLFRAEADPGSAVPPHVHTREDEAFYVTAGRFAVQTGDRSVELGPGEFAFAPRGVVHAWRVLGDTPAQGVVLTTPGGFETFFADMERIGRPSDPTALAEMMAAFARHGLQMGALPAAREAAPAPARHRFDLGDHSAVLLADAEETGGAYALLDVNAEPGGGTPPHTHTREEETFFVLEGRFAILIGGQTVEAGPGDCVYAPRDVVHAWRNAGDTPARMLVLVTPGGIERFFTEVERITAQAAGVLDAAVLEKVMTLAAHYGMEIADPIK